MNGMGKFEDSSNRHRNTTLSRNRIGALVLQLVLNALITWPGFASATSATPSLADLMLTIGSVDDPGVLFLRVNGDTNGGAPFIHYVPPLPAGIMDTRPNLVVGNSRNTKLAVIARAESRRTQLLLLSNEVNSASADFSLEAHIDSCGAGVECRPNGNRIVYKFTFVTADTLGLGLSHANRIVGGTYNNVVVTAPGAHVRSTDPEGVPAVENGSVTIPYSRIAAKSNCLWITVEYLGRVPRWVGLLALAIAFWTSLKADRGSPFLVVNLLFIAIGVTWWVVLGDRIDRTVGADDTKFLAPAFAVYGGAGIFRGMAARVRKRKEA